MAMTTAEAINDLVIEPQSTFSLRAYEEQIAFPSFRDSRVIPTGAIKNFQRLTFNYPETASGSVSIKESSIFIINTAEKGASTSNIISSGAPESLEQKLLAMFALGDEWCGPNATAPSIKGIKDALELLSCLSHLERPDRAAPSADGEISFFWDRPGLYADFGVSGDGTYSFFIDRNNNKHYGDDIAISSGISDDIRTLLSLQE